MTASTDDELGKQLKQHIDEMERLAAQARVQQVSFTLAERAQAKAGYLLFKSSKRIEIASYALVFLTAVLIVVTILLILKKP